MTYEQEAQQAMLERQQRLEEALERAECHTHTQEDMEIIRFECGMPSKKQSHTTQVLNDVFADFEHIFGTKRN